MCKPGLFLMRTGAFWPDYHLIYTRFRFLQDSPQVTANTTRVFMPVANNAAQLSAYSCLQDDKEFLGPKFRQTQVASFQPINTCQTPSTIKWFEIKTFITPDRHRYDQTQVWPHQWWEFPVLPGWRLLHGNDYISDDPVSDWQLWEFL